MHSVLLITKKMKKRLQGLTLLTGLLILAVGHATKVPVIELESTQVVGVSPVQSDGISIDKIPVNV
jgi:hypothetical protein